VRERNSPDRSDNLTLFPNEPWFHAAVTGPSLRGRQSERAMLERPAEASAKTRAIAIVATTVAAFAAAGLAIFWIRTRTRVHAR